MIEVNMKMLRSKTAQQSYEENINKEFKKFKFGNIIKVVWHDKVEYGIVCDCKKQELEQYKILEIKMCKELIITKGVQMFERLAKSEFDYYYNLHWLLENTTVTKVKF